MANKKRDLRRESFWRRALARQQRGGISIRAFCRREKLSEPSFYAWRREIVRRDAGARTRQPARRKATKPRRARQSALAPAFLPIVLADNTWPEPADMVIELRGGRKLRLPESISVARLAELVSALESVPSAVNGGLHEAQP